MISLNVNRNVRVIIPAINLATLQTFFIKGQLMPSVKQNSPVYTTLYTNLDIVPISRQHGIYIETTWLPLW